MTPPAVDGSARRNVALWSTIALLVVLWIAIVVAETAVPRRVVLASGPEYGIYHSHAARYRALLERHGVKVVERATLGAEENLQLLRDPKSGVDVAFMQGGIAADRPDGLVMLASLYYEPLWIFARSAPAALQIRDLAGKRIAAGVPGSGTRALVERVLAASGIGGDAPGATGATIADLGGVDALRALRNGEVDVALFVGGAQTPVIQEALRDPDVRVVSLANAEVYPRRFTYLRKLDLPRGTIDLTRDIPERNVAMIGTTATLVAREDLHPALINLLLDAAREVHAPQGYFEGAGEFPGTAPVDLPVSPYADEHRRFGPSFLHRYLPFWLATLVERVIIVGVPLLVLLVPLLNAMPLLLGWRVRSRIYRTYGELLFLERAVARSPDAADSERWLHDIGRIERTVEGLKVPGKYASQAYTLREHIGLVRRAIEARVGSGSTIARNDRA